MQLRDRLSEREQLHSSAAMTPKTSPKEFSVRFGLEDVCSLHLATAWEQTAD